MTGGSTESQDEQRRVEKQKGNNYKAPPGTDEENQTRSSDRVAMDRAEQQHAGEPEGPPAARAYSHIVNSQQLGIRCIDMRYEI